MQKSQVEIESEMRKEHAQELRKAHFHIGFEKGFNSETSYNQSFQTMNLEGAAKAKQDMLKLRTNLRSTHFQLGSDETSKLFLTTASQSFCPPINPQLARLSVETKKDLRSHHFKLGNNKEPQETSYKSTFQQQDINKDAFNDRKEQSNKLRKHNYEFGDVNEYYSSMYDQNYNQSYDPKFLHQGKSKEEIQQEIIALRKSNLVLGNNLDPQYSTEQNDFYVNKPLHSKSIHNMTLKKSHIEFGIENNRYDTTSSVEFVSRQMAKRDPNVIKALSNNLRSEHFTLGNEVRDFSCESSQKFNQIDRNQIQKQPDLSYLRKSSLNLQSVGLFNPKLHYKSNYKQEYDDYKGLPQTMRARNERQDIGSNVFFGAEKQPDIFQSQSTKNYVDFGIQKRAGLDKETKDNLRRHHYDFGTEQTAYVSESKEIFNDKSKEFVSNKLNSTTLKDLRKNHFEYGTQKLNFETANKDIGMNQCKPTKLDESTAKDLRSHHWSIGDAKS